MRRSRRSTSRTGMQSGEMLTIGIDSVAGPWQIVGIARDTKSQNPRDTDPIRMTYIPLAQIEPYMPLDKSPNAPKPAIREENQDRYANMILLRTAGDPAKVTADLRAVVAAVDPNLPVLKITTIQEQVSNLIANEELISTLTTVFSVLALLLASIGLYGVMSYNVAQRTTEIGVRLALGARAETVLWMVMRESLILLAIGVGLGLPLTLATSRRDSGSTVRTERQGSVDICDCDRGGERNDRDCDVASGSPCGEGRSAGCAAVRVGRHWLFVSRPDHQRIPFVLECRTMKCRPARRTNSRRCRASPLCDADRHELPCRPSFRVHPPDRAPEPSRLSRPTTMRQAGLAGPPAESRCFTDSRNSFAFMPLPSS